MKHNNGTNRYKPMPTPCKPVRMSYFFGFFEGAYGVAYGFCGQLVFLRSVFPSRKINRNHNKKPSP